VWWQSILVWFLRRRHWPRLGLFPLYALPTVRSTPHWRDGGRRSHHRAGVAAGNNLRVPAIGTGLSFLLFFPGSSSRNYLPRGHRQTSNPSGSWLFGGHTVGLSALAYAARLARRRPRQWTDDRTDIDADGNAPARAVVPSRHSATCCWQWRGTLRCIALVELVTAYLDGDSMGKRGHVSTSTLRTCAGCGRAPNRSTRVECHRGFGIGTVDRW